MDWVVWAVLPNVPNLLPTLLGNSSLVHFHFGPCNEQLILEQTNELIFQRKFINTNEKWNDKLKFSCVFGANF